MKKITRYYHTLKHLKPIQLRYQVWYRVRDRFFPVKLPVVGQTPPHRMLKLQPFPAQQTSYLGKNHFRFLNLDQTFKKHINWNYLGHGKLWAYHLNYFEYLHQPDMETDTALMLMRDFITGLEPRSEGLEPYPTSLRALNWIKFMAMRDTRPDDIIQSLHAQYRVLARKIEYHLLGNHLLENSFSLLFGGLFFNNKKLLNLGVSILKEQLKEQILSDGAHFELSPVYHCIILERALDAVNLLSRNEHNLPHLEDQLRESVQNMLNWLDAIRFRNGELPMFNDSVRGQSLTPKQLFDYAGELGFKPEPTRLGASGYRKFVSGEFELVADVGEAGPSYQPGHAHADMLSFVLHHRGKPAIVDRGVSTYEKSPLRQEERGTASHNTVMAGGEEQSDVWGGFRLGRRAHPTIHEEGNGRLTASHNGYRRLGITHLRKWQTETMKVTIFDRIEGGDVACEAFLHFHPSRNVEQINEKRYMTDGITIEFEHAESTELESYRWPAGMNRAEKAQRIRIRFKRELKTVLAS